MKKTVPFTKNGAGAISTKKPGTYEINDKNDNIQYAGMAKAGRLPQRLHQRQEPGLLVGVIEALPVQLGPGDLVVVNDVHVHPARLRARRASGGAVEVLQETSRLRAAKMTLYNQKKAKTGDGSGVPGDGTGLVPATGMPAHSPRAMTIAITRPPRRNGEPPTVRTSRTRCRSRSPRSS